MNTTEGIPLAERYQGALSRIRAAAVAAARAVDDITLVKSCAADLFNHAPAKLFMNTGSGQFGRPSMGSWITYGLGSANADLPGYVVLLSGGKTPDGPRQRQCHDQSFG